MATEAKTSLLKQLEQLRQGYLARLPDELVALRALAERLRGGERDRANLLELQQRLHRLAGSGTTFGCASLSAAARFLEHKIKDWLAVDLTHLDAAAIRVLATELALLGVDADPAATVPDPAAVDMPAVVVGHPFRIWLVDDDRELAEQLKSQIEAFNYQVHVFVSIAEAELAAQSESPDLLIINVLFTQAGDNAAQVLPQTTALRALECPLLFISEQDDFQSRIRAVQLDAAGYLLKPLDVPRLVKRILELLGQRHAQPQRVLIVEDDADLAEHMRLTLLAAGMVVEVLQNRQEIMESIATFRPELVLMDLHMPDYSGPDLAGVIRQYEDYLNLPIVYLSAETDLRQQIKAINRGSDDFLTKPIPDAQLVAAVRARIARARQLDELISKDSLTGLLKHSSIKQAARVEVERAHRTRRPVTLAMLDIDHFKSVNDNYGHASGDVVIAAVATLLRQRLRQSDLVGRYGGEEFVAVLPECDADSAMHLMNDIRQRFSTLRFSHQGKPFICTISIGLVCSADFSERDSEQLLVLADQALYSAKRGGRNRVRSVGADDEL